MVVFRFDGQRLGRTNDHLRSLCYIYEACVDGHVVVSWVLPIDCVVPLEISFSISVKLSYEALSIFLANIVIGHGSFNAMLKWGKDSYV